MAEYAKWMYPSPFYAVGNAVHMPHVGSDRSLVKLTHKSTPGCKSDLLTDKQTCSVNKKYVQKISHGLTFSDAVLKERCFHLLPYSDKYLHEVLDATDIVPIPPKSRQPIGRHDTRGADKRHMPCHIEKRATHKLKPIKRKIIQKAIELHQDAVGKGQKFESKGSSSKRSSQSDEKQDPVFLTEQLNLDGLDIQREEESPQEWDAYLMSQLTETTARYVVARHLSPGGQQEKLNTLLDSYYGPTFEKPDLVQDNISDGEMSDAEKDSPRVSKWKKADESLLDRVRDMQKQAGQSTDPYSDDTSAAFYRLPAGFRRARKHMEKKVAGAINTTAHNVEVKPYKPPPPPTLRDFVNPGVGNKLFDTDNMFEREWLTGARPIHHPGANKEKMYLDTNNQYVKVLQKEVPRKLDQWYPPEEKDSTMQQVYAHKVRMYDRGMHPWKALPIPIDDTVEFQLSVPGHDQSMAQAVDNISRIQARSNATLVQIVSEWRSKWNLDMRYADASPDDLIRDMADIHPHIRLKAITTCARAAEYHPPPEPGIQLEANRKQASQIKLLPEKLFTALECLLDDDHEQVRRATAITMYTLERPMKKAELILRSTLKDSATVDRWAAAQCLAYYGECDSDVVGELSFQLLNTEDPIRYEQTIHLLSSLSENSTLVHSMLGEQLNSSSWRHRVMVCKIMPKLHGQINKDLVNKLTLLMWTDWHSEVRKAAAQTLGKTGHGKDVHDELLKRIINGNERTRVEAVSKVGHLGIMTAKLLPVFLECFHDGYLSVRQEVCVASANLKIEDQQVLSKLIFLATFDPIWKVKALALQAIGRIGITDSDIKECVLWALRYEDQPGVRAEACNTIMALKITSPEVAQILQDRLLVEVSPVVKEEITRALQMFGISATEDMDMVAQIKNEVRKLCNKTNICAQITVNEEENTRKDNIQRMVYISPDQREKEDTSPRHRSFHHMYTRPRSEQSPSHERSMYTPAADREIESILARQDTADSSEAGSRTTSTRSTLSRLQSKSRKNSRSTSLGGESDRKSTATDRKIPEEDERETPKEESMIRVEDNAKQPTLGERDSYVEIPGSSGTRGATDTEDVVTMSHASTGDSQGSGRVVQETKELKTENNDDLDKDRDRLTEQHTGSADCKDSEPNRNDSCENTK